MSKPIFPDEISWGVDFLEGKKNFKFNPDDYYEQYFCEWKVDQRTIDLQDMLYKFYNEHWATSNWDYNKAWKEFNDELLFSGYTREEIIEAKKVVRTWRLKGE